MRISGVSHLLAISLLIAAPIAYGQPAAAFDIEAHRGGRALFPENTLPAFANALSLGVDTLELDLGITKDGVVVVSHERGLNPDLARGPDGAYVPAVMPFVNLTLAEVRTYDVGQLKPGTQYAGQFLEQRAVPGTRIPALVDVIALVRKSGNENVRLNMETKIDPNFPAETRDPEFFAAAVVKLVQDEKFSDRVMIQSFDWRTLQAVQKIAPSIPTVYLTIQRGSAPNIYLDQPSRWTAGFNPADHGKSVPRAIKAAGGAIWSPLFVDVTAASVKEAHDLGLKVVVWTVNQPADMIRMIEIGVDGIIADRPDLLRKAAEAKGIALPKPAPVMP